MTRICDICKKDMKKQGLEELMNLDILLYPIDKANSVYTMAINIVSNYNHDKDICFKCIKNALFCKLNQLENEVQLKGLE
jgi:hypothetical protein